MDVLVTLFYLLFSICVIYPPTEFVSAGFTIAQLFESFLGSENMNFIGYHMKRTTITALIHSALPLGYVFCLLLAGERNPWLPAAAAATAIIPLLMCYRLLCWWENGQAKHPVVKSLLAYVTPGTDWRVVAANLNIEFRNVDKVSIQLNATSRFVATETWLIKLMQYKLNVVKQRDCTLVATATDSHNLTPSGEDEIQYINIEAIPTRDDLDRFTFRISTTALRDLQPRLSQAIRVPDHISLLPTLIERFVHVFKQYVDQNPVYYVDQCAVVLLVHGPLVGGARGGPPGGLAGGPRHVPGVPRALLPAGRVPGARARLLMPAPAARAAHRHRHLPALRDTCVLGCYSTSDRGVANRLIATISPVDRGKAKDISNYKTDFANLAKDTQTQCSH